MESLLRSTLAREFTMVQQDLCTADERMEIEGVVLRIELLYGHVLRLHSSNLSRNIITDEVVDLIRSLYQTLTELIEEMRTSARSNFNTTVLFSGQRGRPMYDIPKEQLEYFIDNGFTVQMMSNMVGVSLSTIHRRLDEYGLCIRETYSNISDTELNNIVTQGYLLFPNAGYCFIDGWLRQQGIKVQQNRVRQSVREVDPVGVANRWLTAIKRRKYSVCGPQALWHLDGNHKLIRWRFVIHGAIDGFSSTVVYLKCSNNNRAQTVLHLFTKAVFTEGFGLPARIRTDKGVENYDVAMYMLCHPRRGPIMKPVVVGKSVHNQRIERLWRDVFEGVTSTFYSIFYQLEDSNILDPLSEEDLFCLHYVYLDTINHHLSQWKNCWNNHKISGCSGKTPMQMWIEGWQRLNGSGHVLANEMFGILDIDNSYGVDWEGPITPDDQDGAVIVPQIFCPLSSDDYSVLVQNFPREQSAFADGSYGIYTYLNVRSYVQNCNKEV